MSPETESTLNLDGHVPAQAHQPAGQIQADHDLQGRNLLHDQDPRHGTYAGYNAGCRNECCRRAARDYQRQRYFDYAVLGLPPRCIDKTGSSRRVHALQALGWSAETLSSMLGYSRAYLNVAINRDSRRGIHQDTARRIADLYDRLSMTLPPETRCTGRQREIARRKGWLPPLAWDDDTIDDPEFTPSQHDTDVPSIHKKADPIVVERFLDGDRGVPTSRADRIEIVAEYLRLGRPLADCERAGWRPDRYMGQVAS